MTDSQKKDTCFSNFHDYLHETIKILKVSKMGFRVAEHLPESFGATLNWREVVNDTNKSLNMGKVEEIDYVYESKKMDQAKRISQFAITEIQSNFSTIHSNALVSVWGAFEVLIYNVFLLRLHEDPKILDQKIFQSIKLTLSEYLMLEDDERIHYLFNEFKQNQKPQPTNTVSHTEYILSSIGLGPFNDYSSINPELFKLLVEISNIRNLLVHRNGIIDYKFVMACPWYSEKKGEKIQIDSGSLYKYIHALFEYMNLIMLRHLYANGFNYEKFYLSTIKKNNQCCISEDELIG